MQPVHPVEKLHESLKLFLVVLAVLLTTQLLLGHWDAILSTAVEWFPIWHWGG